VALFASLKFPDYSRETEYVSLKSDDEYALYDGYIFSSDKGRVEVADYRTVTNEYVVPWSTCKRTKFARESYQVGALARVNNNYELLLPLAKTVATTLGLKTPCHNPYLISAAQVVETAHCWENSLLMLKELLGNYPDPEDLRVKLRAGKGVGSCEVPRGILFHEYALNERGICETGNCIIPTNQNTANMEDDMKAFVPQMVKQDLAQPQMQKLLLMLVRAYDPCISCSCHALDLELEIK